jgi:hypothetical protein
MKYTILSIIFLLTLTPKMLTNCYKNNSKLEVEEMEKVLSKPHFNYSVKSIADTSIHDDCIIKGSVYDLNNGHPLKSAIISVQDTYGTMAKENGTFEIRVPAGEFKIKILMVGYPIIYTKKLHMKGNTIIQIEVFIEKHVTN